MCFAMLGTSCDDNEDPGTAGETEMEEEMEVEMEEETEPEVEAFTETLRFASFNVSLFRDTEGGLVSDLSNGENEDIKKVAEVIQTVRPDFLALMEFDYDAAGNALELFRSNYLEQPQNGQEIMEYPHAYAAPSNTGLLAEVDIDSNGSISLPNDAYGFGNFEGQFAFALLSKYPIKTEELRSFQNFKWTDLENATLPKNADGSNFYSDEALEVFRLSSKNHIDMPVELPDGRIVHALLSHPTPPVFDGAEDRNGLRNHDEIKLFADYISGAEYLTDDQGNSGGLSSDDFFVIMGDQNADPLDGDSAMDAIRQLLDHPRVNQAVTFGEHIPASVGGQIHNQQSGDTGEPQFDTSFFGLRVDYVLPSANLQVSDSAVFWPDPTDIQTALTSASDHLLVWVDFRLP